MRNWSRYERAATLRGEGKSLTEIGHALDVSSERARQMVAAWNKRLAELEAAKDAPPPWFNGLSPRAVAALKRMGYQSREDCQALAGENLNFRYGRADDPRRPPGSKWRSSSSIQIRVLNEVREWLGAPPVELPAKPPNARDAPHVVFRTTDQAFACLHCGESYRPRLPILVDLFVALSDAFTKLHRPCPAPVKQEEQC